jgi:hypothetical protein
MMIQLKSHKIRNSLTCACVLMAHINIVSAQEMKEEAAKFDNLKALVELDVNSFYHFSTALLGIFYAFYFFKKNKIKSIFKIHDKEK